MLKYKDFVPRHIPQQRRGFFSGAEDSRHESFGDACEAANAWIVDQSINIINIETVVLPNIWEDHEEGSDDGKLYTGSSAAYWHQFLRIWYNDGV